MATRTRPAKAQAVTSAAEIDELLKQADELESKVKESSTKVAAHLAKAEEARATLRKFVEKYG